MAKVREALLRKQLLQISNEQNYINAEFNIAAVPITGSNFTSELFHVTISSLGREDIKLFAKVAVIGEELRKLIFKRIFEIEPYVYTKLFTIYKQLEDRHQVPKGNRLATPKFYGYSETYMEEVIVLEDLSADGYTTYDRFKSIDWEYAAASVEQLARLHGLSVAYQKEFPQEYEETKDTLTTEEINFGEGMTKKLMWEAVGRSLELIREQNRTRVQHFFNKKFVPGTSMNYVKGKRPVIIHNDFKQANLMHKFDENGKLQVVIVDYQTLRQSTAATDLLHFVFNCADGGFRKRYYQRLIEHYYEHMTTVLRRLHLDPEEVYPRADFDEELKETLPYAFMHSIMRLPIFYMEQSEVKQFNGEEDLESLSSMMLKPSALCAERMNELVDDCIRWGVLDE